MAESVEAHRASSRRILGIAVLTVSDTRTIATDASGDLIVHLLESAGHRLGARELVPDEPDQIRRVLGAWTRQPTVDAILVTGGTGISPRDRTAETIAALLTRPLPGFGELFRMLSYAQIGPAAMLSRATGGLIERQVVLVLPGSRAAVQLAMEQLILPELPHIVHEANKQ